MQIALKILWQMQMSIVKMRKAKLEGRNHFYMARLLKEISSFLETLGKSRLAIYEKYATEEEKAVGCDIKQSNPKYVKSMEEFEEILDEEVTIQGFKIINLSIEDAEQLEIGVLQDFDSFIDVDSMKSCPEGAKDGKKGKKKGKAHA